MFHPIARTNVHFPLTQYLAIALGPILRCVMLCLSTNAKFREWKIEVLLTDTCLTVLKLKKACQIGKWSYYKAKTNSSTKFVADSIYVFKPWKRGINDYNIKYRHTIENFAANPMSIKDILD